MSFWSDVIATGSGVVDYRLMVEGWPHEWVTNPRITHGDGRGERVVYPGLLYKGMHFSEQSVLRDAWPQCSGMSFTIVPTDSNEDTLNSFTRDARQTGSLTVGLSDTDTTWTTRPATFPAGIYHIGTEAIYCDGADNIVRAHWNTKAQTHVIDLVNNGITVPMYNWPPTMDGRRAYLYAYGSSDDVAGDGTVIWRGIVARPPRMASDGVSWTLDVMPITSAFDQAVGAGDSVEYRIRGIYHSSRCPMTVWFLGGSQDYPSAMPRVRRITGFFETAEEWVSHVNGELFDMLDDEAPGALLALGYHMNDGHPSFGGSINADEWFEIAVKDALDGDTMDGAPATDENGTAHNGEPLSGRFTVTCGDKSGNFFIWDCNYLPPWEYPLPEARALVGDPALGLYGPGDPALGAVGIIGPITAVYQDGTDTTFPNNILYMQNVDGLEVGELLMVRNGDDEPRVITISAIDTVNRTIELDTAHMGAMYFSSDSVMVKVTEYGRGTNWSGFMDEVVTQSPKANLGQTPWITTNDVNNTNWSNIWATYPFHPYWAQRLYRFVKPVKVKDVLAPEFMVTGWMGRLNTDGRFDVVQMPYVSSSRTADHTLTDDEILLPANGMAGAFPTWESQRDGLINITYLRLGYSPLLDDVDARFDFTIRMTQSISEHKSGDKAKQEITPKSTPSGAQQVKQRLAKTPPASDLANMVLPYLQTLSQDYAIVTVSVPFTKFYVLCGDIISVTSAYVPDGIGGRGVANKKAICVGREWNLDPAENAMGKLTLWFPRDTGRTAGYAPTGRITNRVNTSGSIWVLTFDVGNARNIAWSESNDGDVVKHFAVGDGVEILEVDVDAESRFVGVITDVPTATTIEVTVDGTWVPGGSTWNLRFAMGESGPFNTNGDRQFEYCWVADDDGFLSDGTSAKSFL